MKKNFVVILSFICMLSTSLSWAYYSEKDNFSIAFPEEPRIITTKPKVSEGEISITAYQSTDNIGLYTVSVGKFSPKLTKADERKEFANNFLNNVMREASETKLIYKNETVFKDFDAIEYQYHSKYKGVDWTHTGLYFLKDNSTYIKITWVCFKGRYARSRYKDFVDSFSLKRRDNKNG